MKRNEARRYLERYGRATENLIQIEQELEKLRTVAESMQINMDGMPHGTGTSDRVGNIAAEIVDYQAELSRSQLEAIQTRREIFRVISAIPGAAESKVLNGLYIHGDTLADIARRCHKSYQWADEMKRRGLDQVADILTRINKE